LVCHMAGTMKFSEVPPYPYTSRSLHRVRTGKMRTKRTFAWRPDAVFKPISSRCDVRFLPR